MSQRPDMPPNLHYCQCWHWLSFFPWCAQHLMVWHGTSDFLAAEANGDTHCTGPWSWVHRTQKAEQYLVIQGSNASRHSEITCSGKHKAAVSLWNIRKNVCFFPNNSLKAKLEITLWHLMKEGIFTVTSSELIFVMAMHLSRRGKAAHSSDFPRDWNVHNDIINPAMQRNVTTHLPRLFHTPAHQEMFNL